MNKKDLARYKERFCKILVKKRNAYDCMFCTVEAVNDRQVYVTNTRGTWFKIPIELIKSIQVNEE
jgi:hypothetical protein